MVCTVTIADLTFKGVNSYTLPEGRNLIGANITVSDCVLGEVVEVYGDNTSKAFTNGEYTLETSFGNPVSIEITNVLTDDEEEKPFEYEKDPDFFKKKRYPPFDKPPLNILPITKFPDKFVWKDKNVKYLTFFSVGSSCSLYCCCFMLMLMLLKR